MLVLNNQHCASALPTKFLAECSADQNLYAVWRVMLPWFVFLFSQRILHVRMTFMWPISGSLAPQWICIWRQQLSPKICLIGKWCNGNLYFMRLVQMDFPVNQVINMADVFWTGHTVFLLYASIKSRVLLTLAAYLYSCTWCKRSDSTPVIDIYKFFIHRSSISKEKHNKAICMRLYVERMWVSQPVMKGYFEVLHQKLLLVLSGTSC